MRRSSHAAFKRVALATVFVLLVVSVVAIAASARQGPQAFAGITLVGISWGSVWTDGTQAIFCGALEPTAAARAGSGRTTAPR
jgi:hypothetical protein